MTDAEIVKLARKVRAAQKEGSGEAQRLEALLDEALAQRAEQQVMFAPEGERGPYG